MMSIARFIAIILAATSALVNGGEAAIIGNQRDAAVLSSLPEGASLIYDYDSTFGESKDRRNLRFKVTHDKPGQVEFLILSATSEINKSTTNIIDKLTDRFPAIKINQSNWKIHSSVSRNADTDSIPIQNCIRALFDDLSKNEKPLKEGDVFRTKFMQPHLRIAEAAKVLKADDNEVRFEIFIPKEPLPPESQEDRDEQDKKLESVNWARDNINKTDDPRKIAAYQSMIENANTSRNGYVGEVTIERKSKALISLHLRLEAGDLSHEFKIRRSK